MAKENLDRTTIDLFAEEKRAGRPKTNPLSRKEQLKHNKRNQLSRDKANGLKRIELKVEQDLFDMLNKVCYTPHVINVILIGIKLSQF